MHDASQYRQIRVVITLGARHHLVAVHAVRKTRVGPERSALVKQISIAASPTETSHDIIMASALALLETADRL